MPSWRRVTASAVIAAQAETRGSEQKKLTASAVIPAQAGTQGSEQKKLTASAVIPAQAGTQGSAKRCVWDALYSRLRGNDDMMGMT